MEHQTLIKNFLDKEGKIKIYPSKRKNMILCLFYLIEKFEHNKEYTEIEVNDIIKKHHTFEDHCLLRRSLIDFKFLIRDSKSIYMLNTTLPTYQDFIELKDLV